MTSLFRIFLLPVCLLKSAPCWTPAITGTCDQTASLSRPLSRHFFVGRISPSPAADHTSLKHVTMTTDRQRFLVRLWRTRQAHPKLIRTYCSGSGRRQSLEDICRRTPRRRPPGGSSPSPGRGRRSGRGCGCTDLLEEEERSQLRGQVPLAGGRASCPRASHRSPSRCRFRRRSRLDRCR